MRAANQLRENIRSLLEARHENQKDLAFYLKRHPTTISKFLKGQREVQLSDLDGIADFFGIATYQLFQPGISLLTERRSGLDRRKGRERRISHAQRAMREVAPKIETARRRARTDERDE